MLSDDLDNAERLIKLGSVFGECEVFVFRDYENSVNIQKNSVDLIESHSSFEVGFRVFSGGKEGYAYANSFDDAVIEDAVKAARISKEKYFYGLPERNTFRFESVDKKILDFLCDSEEISDYTKIFDEKTFLSESDVSFGSSESLILNSNGVSGEKKTTFFSVEGMCNHENGEVSTSVDGISERFMFDLHEFGEKLKKSAVESSNPRRAPYIPETVVFNPDTFSELLGVFSGNFDAENVEKGNSVLEGKTGQEILRGISIIDDPEMEKGLSSTSFDSEGVKTKKKFLMEDGILKSFIYDYNTARKFKVEPTGNAVRSGASSPSIGFHNFVVESKNHEKEIFSGVEKGIYVCSIIGVHTSDPATTEFSVKMERGFLVERGEIKYPIKDLIISGRFIDLEILNLSGETENRGGIYTPCAVCKNVSVV